MRLLLLVAIARCVAGQFGNLRVTWSDGGVAAVAQDSPVREAPAQDSRQVNLLSMSSEQLSAIVNSFGTSCDTCSTTGHWISKVRSSILELQPKQLRAELAKRGELLH